MKKDNKDKSNKKNDNSKSLIKKKKSNKEKISKISEIIKKKWLIKSTTTFLFIAIIIGIFVGITIIVKKQNFTPIDLTEEKVHTLTSESKEKVKDVDKNINVFFVGFEDNNSMLDLAKQYTKINDKINVEAVTASSRPDLVQKYSIDSSSSGIIVESGEKFKVLEQEDLYTMDNETFETVDVTEEKLTAAIRNVSSEIVPKVYFLTGNTDFTLNSIMNNFNYYLQNEINEVIEIDLLTTGTVPDDCDTLVITTPNKDFDEITTNAIIDYINKGGKILWLNSIVESSNFVNVNKILGLYGINPFEYGIIRETDYSKMVKSEPSFILPEIESTEVTEKINDDNIVLINANKINLMDENKLEELKVEETELLNASETSCYITDFSETGSISNKDNQTGPFLLGALLDKTIKEKNEEEGVEELKSKLIIIGENYFISDYPFPNIQIPLIEIGRQNKDLVLNSISYLSDKREEMTIRKNTHATSYEITEKQNRIILIIITIVPILIIIIGIIVWRKRRRKN